MPRWRNMPSLPKGRRASRRIGTMCLPISLSRISAVSARTKAMVVEISRPSPEPFSSWSKAASGGTGGAFCGLLPALRDEAAERLSALEHVLHLGRVRRRNVERHLLLELLVRDRDGELVAHLLDRGDVDLLQLVRRVLRLALLAQAIALDGLRQDHGRLALVLHRCGIGRVDLVGIVAAPVQ